MWLWEAACKFSPIGAHWIDKCVLYPILIPWLCQCNTYMIYSQYCITIWQQTSYCMYHKIVTYLGTKHPKLYFKKGGRENIFYTIKYIWICNSASWKQNIYKRYFHNFKCFSFLHCIHTQNGTMHIILKSWNSCIKNKTPNLNSNYKTINTNCITSFIAFCNLYFFSQFSQLNILYCSN